MALKLKLDSQAVKDLRAIRIYLPAEAGSLVADRVWGHLLKRIDSLQHNPRLGIATTEPDLRILPAARYPYRIYYTIVPDAVVILHIRHTARRDPDFTNLSN